MTTIADLETKARVLTHYILNNPQGIMVTFRKPGTTWHHTLVFVGSFYPYATPEPGTLAKFGVKEILVTAENQAELFANETYVDPMTLLENKDFAIQGTAYDSYFRVYDTATATASQCQNVLYTSTVSYSTYGGIDNIVNIRIVK